MFRKLRGVKLPYSKQGLIYFICMNIKDMPEGIQNKISSLCIEVGKENHKALYALLTDKSKNIHSVAMDYFVSESQLYRIRKKFYEQWGKTFF